MQCTEDLDFYLSAVLFISGVLYLIRQLALPAPYGKHVENDKKHRYIMVPAKYAWFIQEVPSFLVPVLVILHSQQKWGTLSCMMLLFMFCGHYFHRSFIYSAFTRGRPTPLHIVIMAVAFCSYNGFLQGHCLVYGAAYDKEWYKDIRFASGIMIFIIGMGINIHSDHILRNLRKPKEVSYKIPQGGMFKYVSGANFLGEIVEWFGYAIATWTLPAFAFAFFTLCSIGPRAYHHHRYYLQVFKDYPKERKALIPLIF
ncbi:3-oxo-5-alpha-steroid 4-dehydrogenase 2-like [Pelobates cultripes]|uniref:3-oxo-5alpha-steroid 4-dehydrogenase (NADP(+)) n=1 Tax=Pelobates cultripes TaxID=61616 RepID=A0AAD1VUX5_PELCU|nr:3-oxo-5-alpha-steroid 4-dehydrogenase 2-like [Pelobates cultripes]